MRTERAHCVYAVAQDWINICGTRQLWTLKNTLIQLKQLFTTKMESNFYMKKGGPWAALEYVLSSKGCEMNYSVPTKVQPAHQAVPAGSTAPAYVVSSKNDASKSNGSAGDAGSEYVAPMVVQSIAVRPDAAAACDA